MPVLATFVIGLREGLEASLIVGIVSAFLVQRGERRALRSVWAGVLLAVALCLGAAAALQAATRSLPQRQQEQLETVLALVAVAMVTWMVVWTTRHARTLRAELEASTSSALAKGSAWALVAMAFLAVLREGLETSVFLLATYQASGSNAGGALGASLGVLLAAALGYAVYRGGVRLDLGRLFRVTGVVLVLVAAGLVMSAAHTAYEAGWLLAGQGTAVDLSTLVTPGTVRSALFTGVLGWQPRPTVAEVTGWLLYLLPMLVVVLRPRAGRPAPQRVPA
nr:iron uptake transporter permease EfeU [Kineococcus aurantiacus]